MNEFGNCKICRLNLAGDIQAEIEKGTLTANIPMMFGNKFSRATLFNHLKDCLKGNQKYFTEKAKLQTLEQLANQYKPLIQIAAEALQAAREVLLVDGVINYNPRAHEIKIVYEHPSKRDANDKPLVVTETLEEVIEMLEDKGVKVKRTILKQEDIRKTLRESIASCESILNKLYKVFGQRETNEKHELYDRIRARLQALALKKQISYADEVALCLEVYGHTLEPALKQLLTQELVGIRQGILPETPDTSRPKLLPGMPQKETP